MNTSKFLKINKINKPLQNILEKEQTQIANIMPDKGDITIETYRH